MSVGSSRAATTGHAITWVGWQRICGLSGIIFSSLGIAANVITATSPLSLSDSPAQVMLTYREHHTSVVTADFLLAIGAFFFLWFLGGLRSALRQQDQEPGTLSSIAFASGVVVAAALLIVAALESGFAFRVASLPHPGPAQSLLALLVSNTVGILLTFVWLGGAGVVSAVSMANLWTGFQPRWLAYAGLALTLVLLANPFVLFSRGGGFWSTLSAVAFGGFLLWTLATSIYLFLRANLRAPRW
jgi:hypothetical protein